MRDRYNLLAERLRMKLKKEAKESGISPNMTETEQALEFLIELEEASDKLQQETSDKIKQKATSDRKDAEEVRRKAMEKLAVSQKRKSGDDGGERKKRSSGSDTIAFLKERNEQQMSLARDKLELKSMQLQSDAKRHDDLIRFMQHQQQLQMQNFQVFMTQHQEQMNVQQQQHMQLIVKLLDRVGK